MKKEDIRINAVILLIASLMYLALLSPFSVTRAANAAMPVYRSSGDEQTSIIIRLSWDSKAVDNILSILKEAGEKAAFAVTEELASGSPSLISKIARSGHEVSLLASSGEDLEKACGLLERITGRRQTFVVTDSKGAQSLVSCAKELSLAVIVPSVEFDAASMRRAERGGLAQTALKGCFIAVDPTADVSAELPFFIESIKNMGLHIVSIHKMLYN